MDIVSGQIHNKTVKNSDHTVEKNPCKAKVCVTCQEMMLLVALMILWQHRTISSPQTPKTDIRFSEFSENFGTDPLAHSVCSTWCCPGGRTNWLQQLGLIPSVSLSVLLTVTVCSQSLQKQKSFPMTDPI